MIPEARIDGRKRRGRLTQEITYQKVLLAVYMLSDDTGLVCSASNARIGLECGHNVDAVRRSLADMRSRGVIIDFDTRDGFNCRKIVLMDHLDAEEFVLDLNRDCLSRGRRREHHA
jgi:hypothetical protein